MFRAPRLTRSRIRAAFVVAVAADTFQVLLGPLGLTFVDEVIDVIAMLAISSAIGFHPLLLPTFLIELVPFVDMLPTWTACVALVVSLRKRQQKGSSVQNPTTIDV